MTLPRAAVWAGTLLLAVAFGFAGVSKLRGPSAARWADRFAHWGYPANARYVVGALEILGAVGVLIPRCRRPAAALLVALMIGAFGTHAAHAELPRLGPPLVLGGIAFLLYWSRPPSRPNGA
jgi:putative oxidoreductase